MGRKKATWTPAPVLEARALGLIQPAATLLTRGYAPELLRPYGVSYRGPLWIYAALKWNDEIAGVSLKYKDILYNTLGYNSKKTKLRPTENPLPVGAIIGRAELAACDPTDVGYSDTDEECIDVIDGEQKTVYIAFFEKSYYTYRYKWRFENIEYFEDRHRVRVEESYPGLFRVESVPTANLIPARSPYVLAPVDFGREQLQFVKR